MVLAMHAIDKPFGSFLYANRCKISKDLRSLHPNVQYDITTLVLGASFTVGLSLYALSVACLNYNFIYFIGNDLVVKF